MPLLYSREEHGDQVVLRVSPLWYVSRYGTLGLAIAYLVLIGPLGTVGGAAVLAAFAVLAAVRLLGQWSLRKELAAVMKQDAIQARGSAWNPSQPLEYSYRRQLPAATVVERS